MDKEKSIFSKVVLHEIQADIVYQDDMVTAFRDIHPLAPTHILIVTNKPIPTVNSITDDDKVLLGHMFTVASKIASQEGISDTGYRLIVNCNKDAGQEVFHLHMHLLGGKPLGPILAV